MIPDNEDVIVIDKYVKSADAPVNDNSHYKGLRVHALNGLHEFIVDKIKNNFKLNSFVLDLGAGTGAMSLRLSELGFNVTAADIVPNNFKLHEVVPFIKVNLNDTFSCSFEKQFNGIVAIEIIEHLENPRKFLRECYKLTKSGGMLIMSTPNIDNPVSKASFFRNGTFQWYSDNDYEEHGHITPIPQWLLKKCISESKFNLEWIGTFGDPFAYTKKWWKIRLFAQLMQLFSIADKSLNGEISIVVLRKPYDSEKS